jgi:hypothetical protein
MRSRPVTSSPRWCLSTTGSWALSTRTPLGTTSPTGPGRRAIRRGPAIGTPRLYPSASGRLAQITRTSWPIAPTSLIGWEGGRFGRGSRPVRRAAARIRADPGPGAPAHSGPSRQPRPLDQTGRQWPCARRQVATAYAVRRRGRCCKCCQFGPQITIFNNVTDGAQIEPYLRGLAPEALRKSGGVAANDSGRAGSARRQPISGSWLAPSRPGSVRPGPGGGVSGGWPGSRAATSAVLGQEANRSRSTVMSPLVSPVTANAASGSRSSRRPASAKSGPSRLGSRRGRS